MAYGRTLSDKDFGGFRADCSAELQEGDDVQGCMNTLKEFVLRNVNEDILKTEPPSNPAPVKAPQEEKEVKPKVKKPLAKEKKETKAKVKKKALAPYDRSLPVHKELFLALAKDLKLRKGDSDNERTALKETSLFMEGKDMLEVGSLDILQSFKDACVFQYNDFLSKLAVDV